MARSCERTYADRRYPKREILQIFVLQMRLAVKWITFSRLITCVYINNATNTQARARALENNRKRFAVNFCVYCSHFMRLVWCRARKTPVNHCNKRRSFIRTVFGGNELRLLCFGLFDACGGGFSEFYSMTGLFFWTDCGLLDPCAPFKHTIDEQKLPNHNGFEMNHNSFVGLICCCCPAIHTNSSIFIYFSAM